MIVIGIDPGLHTGVAIIRDGELAFATLDDPRDCLDAEQAEDSHVFIECPQIYPHGGKGDPNDLIKLAVMVGRYAEYLENHTLSLGVRLVHPHAWKGNVPKQVTERRMLAKYDTLEIFLDEVPKSLRHNVIDAVGIADYGYNRICLRGQ